MTAISVIIPTYNHANYVGQAIQSVLDQTFADFELVVVDDGSTDKTPAVLAQFQDLRLRAIRQRNGGLSAARNTGIRATSAPLVTFLDADDLFLPDKLALLTAYLDEHPNVGLVAGGTRLIDSTGSTLVDQVNAPASLTLPALLCANSLPVSGILLRRVWLDRVGIFDETLRACEDWDLWLRMLLAGCQFGWVEEPVVAYRLHPGQMTREADRMRTAMLTVLDKFFNQADLPEQIRAFRNQVFAAAFVNAAARAYRSREFEAAQRDLAEAVNLDPLLVEGRYEHLLRLFMGWAEDPQTPEPDVYLQDILGHLPASLHNMRDELRKAIAKVILRPLFQVPHPSRRNHKGALLRAIRYDPAWLFNRGVVRMLIDACLPGGSRIAV